MTETKGPQKPLPPSPRREKGVKTWFKQILGKERHPTPVDLRPNFNFGVPEQAGSPGYVAEPTAPAMAEAFLPDDPPKERKSTRAPRRATYSNGAGAVRNDPQGRVERSSSTAGRFHARSDSGQHPTVSPPRRRTTTSVERSDDRGAWILQKTEMERVIHGQAATISQNDAEIRALKLQNETVGKRAEELEKMYQDAKRDTHDVVAEQSQSQLAQVEEMQRRCRRLERELEKSKKLLADRTEELSAAQAFMTTADQYSAADVSRMVEQLNEDFFQCAMDISDTLLQYRQPGPPSSVVQESRRLIAKRWDEGTLVRLEADIAQDDTVMFECLVQSAFMSEARNVISSFSLESGDVEKHMKKLWKAISTSHEISIAKNWLAITMSASDHRTHDYSRLMRYLHALLVVAGWREPLDSKVLERVVQGRLTDMTEKAEKIRDTIFKGVLSAHMEVFEYEGGREFDPATMQDAYEVPERQALATNGGQASTVGYGPIVCSTGLGLRCLTKSSRSSSRGLRKEVVILKPKVLLSSTLLADDRSTRNSRVQERWPSTV